MIRAAIVTNFLIVSRAKSADRRRAQAPGRRCAEPQLELASAAAAKAQPFWCFHCNASRPQGHTLPVSGWRSSGMISSNSGINATVSSMFSNSWMTDASRMPVHCEEATSWRRSSPSTLPSPSSSVRNTPRKWPVQPQSLAACCAAPSTDRSSRGAALQKRFAPVFRAPGSPRTVNSEVC